MARTIVKTVTVTEAKNRLSALLAEVRAGETILIVDRGIPVARIEGVGLRGGDDTGRLERLYRAGLLKRPRTDFPRRIVSEEPPSLGPSAVDALIDERRVGR
jgi:prevent-host-death family protein